MEDHVVSISRYHANEQTTGLGQRWLVVLSVWLLLILVTQKVEADVPTTRRPAVDGIAGLKVVVVGRGTLPFGTLLGKRTTAVVFLSVNCPISNGYSVDLLSLAASIRGRGGELILVYSNPGDIPEVPEHIRKFGLRGLPVVLDENQSVADRLHARVTPQAFVLDVTGKVRYSGRIDDRYISRGKPKGSVARTEELANALRAVIDGKPVATIATQASGCLIERRSHPLKVGPTYAQQVAPILNRHCVQCHHANEVGPMPLTTLAEARRYAKNIASVTAAHLMPPWKPTLAPKSKIATPASSRVDLSSQRETDSSNDMCRFVEERGLTSAEIETLQSWAETGAAAGDMTFAPKPPQFSSGWSMGKPDLTLKMSRPFNVPASGPDIHRCFVLPTDLPHDTHVMAVVYLPGNRRVARQITGFIDTTGTARQLEIKAREKGPTKTHAKEPGYVSFGGPGFLPKGEIGGWAPGRRVHKLPQNVVFDLPARSDLVLQIIYHPNGRPEQDQTQIGLYFAPKEQSRASTIADTNHKLRLISLTASHLTIPPGAVNYPVEHTISLPFDIKMLSVRPHMHLLGKRIHVTATLPNGSERTLIEIDDWDYNWQDFYTFRHPIDLPKGTRLRISAVYDNSADNPRQPSHPPKQIMWGRHITDEMCAAYLTYIAVDENQPLVRMMDGFPPIDRKRDHRGSDTEQPNK